MEEKGVRLRMNPRLEINLLIQETPDNRTTAQLNPNRKSEIKRLARLDRKSEIRNLFFFIFMVPKHTMLTYEDVKNAHEVLRNLQQYNRLRIIELLQKHAVLNVTDLCEKLALDQGLVSHHLRILTEIKILEQRKNGKYTDYSLNYMRLAQVRSIINDLLDS